MRFGNVIAAHHGRLLGAGGEWTPPSGLLGWWYGNATTDSKWTDRSGNGRHMTLYGNAALSAANGLQSPNRDGYANWAGALWTVPLTLAFWLNIEQYQLYDAVIGGEGATNTIDQRAGPTLALGAAINRAVALVVGSWEFYAFRFVSSGGGVTSIFKGQSKSDFSATVPHNPRGDNILRFSSAFQRSPKGYIDDVQYYSAALSDDDILDIRANSPGSHA